MIQEFSDYKLEITNQSYKSLSGIPFPKTALLQLILNGTGNKICLELGYADKEYIFRMIKNGEKIILDNCYIPSFSLSEYRKLHKMDPRELVDLHDFSAENSFFDSKEEFDFSFATYHGKALSFDGSTFAHGELNFHNSNIKTEKFIFSNVHYHPGNINLSNVRFGSTEILLKNSNFSEGKKDFQYTDFGNGDKNFSNTYFGKGTVSFVNTQFNNGNTFFKLTRFGTGKVDFHFAKFGTGDISFERTEFNDGEVDFRTVEFGEGRVNFNRCSIGTGDMSFEGCDQSSGKFSLKRAKLKKGNLNFELAEMSNVDLSFDRTDFGQDSISFYDGKFKTVSFQHCHLNHYTDLRVRKCNVIDLSNTIVRDIIDLKPYEFSEDIGIIRFGGMRLIGRIYIDWHRNNVFTLIKNQSESNNRQKADQFRTLKENFNNCGQYHDEDRAYLQFKRYEARNALETNLSRKGPHGLWAWPWHIFKLLIFDYAGHYATNPARVILSMITTLSFFSLLYSLLISLGIGNIIESADHIQKMNSLGIGFYHSAITFFTIGYGDYYPSGIIRWLSGLEGFSGMFFMSYFTVAFVRKILR